MVTICNLCSKMSFPGEIWCLSLLIVWSHTNHSNTRFKLCCRIFHKSNFLSVISYIMYTILSIFKSLKKKNTTDIAKTMFSLLFIGGHCENQDGHQLHTFITLQQAVPNAQRVPLSKKIAFTYYSFVVNGTKNLGTWLPD